MEPIPGRYALKYEYFLNVFLNTFLDFNGCRISKAVEIWDNSLKFFSEILKILLLMLSELKRIN